MDYKMNPMVLGGKYQPITHTVLNSISIDMEKLSKYRVLNAWLFEPFQYIRLSLMVFFEIIKEILVI